MSYSITDTESTTFTLTHAKYLASKVATDLKRMQRFYYYPSDDFIAQLEQELALYLKAGYLGTVTYGFKKDGKWIEPTLKYTAKDIAGMAGTDDDPGRVLPGKNVDGANFYTYLTYSTAWSAASIGEREQFAKSLPYSRGTASEPEFSGYFADDRSYYAAGRSLGRSSLKN